MWRACASTATRRPTITSRAWCAGASTTCRRGRAAGCAGLCAPPRASRCSITASSSTAAALAVAGAVAHPGTHHQQGGRMPGKNLKGTKSLENLKEAFAGESQANRRYLYFARVADIEGFPDIAGLFKDTADAESGHPLGHPDFLKEGGEPGTDGPIRKTQKNPKSPVAGQTHED